MPKPKFSWGSRPRRVYLESADDSLYPDADRPVTRAECRNGIRPCPYVGCRHHLYLNWGDGRDHMGVVVNFPDLDPLEIPETCALDVADRGESSVAEVGVLLNLSKSGVEKIAAKALKVLRGCVEDQS